MGKPIVLRATSPRKYARNKIPISQKVPNLNELSPNPEEIKHFTFTVEQNDDEENGNDVGEENKEIAEVISEEKVESENEEEIIKKRTTDEMEASQTDAKINNLNRQQTEVFLRIYDVTQGLAKVVSPQLLGFQIDGVWHTSIEIFENEYYFQNFLSVQRAGTTPFNHYTERISLGHTDCTQHELMGFFEASKDRKKFM